MELLCQPEAFKVALTAFVAAIKAKSDAYYKASFPNLPTPDFTTTVGPKFVRVVRIENYGGGKSVHCFVEVETGNVLKAAGWARPAKTSRGNIFDADGGVSALTDYGVKYLR